MEWKEFTDKFAEETKNGRQNVTVALRCGACIMANRLEEHEIFQVVYLQQGKRVVAVVSPGQVEKVC